MVFVNWFTAQCADFILIVKCSQLDQDLSQYAERGVAPDERKVSPFKWICVERLNRKLCLLERCKLQRDKAADEGRVACSVSVGEGNIKRKHCSDLRHQDSRELNM